MSHTVVLTGSLLDKAMCRFLAATVYTSCLCFEHREGGPLAIDDSAAGASVERLPRRTTRFVLMRTTRAWLLHEERAHLLCFRGQTREKAVRSVAVRPPPLDTGPPLPDLTAETRAGGRPHHGFSEVMCNNSRHATHAARRRRPVQAPRLHDACVAPCHSCTACRGLVNPLQLEQPSKSIPQARGAATLSGCRHSLLDRVHRHTAPQRIAVVSDRERTEKQIMLVSTSTPRPSRLTLVSGPACCLLGGVVSATGSVDAAQHLRGGLPCRAAAGGISRGSDSRARPHVPATRPKKEGRTGAPAEPVVDGWPLLLPSMRRTAAVAVRAVR